MILSWEGIFPALTTQFTAEDTLDLRLLEVNLLAQVSAGVSGVIIGGGLGEANCLTTAEKEALVKFSVEKVESALPVILYIAGGSTKEAMRQVEMARYWGAKALVLQSPLRYVADLRETATFYKTVAGATELPIMIGNDPAYSTSDLFPRLWDQLEGLPNIQAIADSTGNVAALSKIINRYRDRFQIVCAVDAVAMEELVMGASGWAGGMTVAFPEEAMTIYRLVKKGRIPEALALYRWFQPLLELSAHPKSVQYIKLAEAQLGLGSEYVRAPRLMLEGEERERITTIIGNCLSARSVTQ
jgi:1-pyrroline-4-hydroxy-2-carboxylate deaminase